MAQRRAYKLIYGYFYDQAAADEYLSQLEEIYKTDTAAGKVVSISQMCRHAEYYGVKIDATTIRTHLIRKKAYSPVKYRPPKKVDTIVSYRADAALKEILKAFPSQSGASYMIITAALGFKTPTFIIAYFDKDIPLIFTMDKKNRLIAIFIRQIQEDMTQLIRGLLKTINNQQPSERMSYLKNYLRVSGIKFIGGVE